MLYSVARIYVIIALKVKFNGEFCLELQIHRRVILYQHNDADLFKIKPRPQEFSFSMGIINSDYHSTFEFFTGIIPGPHLEC